MVSLNRLLIIAFILSSIIIYFFLPSTIPTHWGPSGEIDAYGPSWTLLLIPLMTVGFYYLWVLIPRIAIFKQNIKKLGKRYHQFLTALLLFFLAMYLMMVVSAFGLIINIKFLIIPSLTALFYYIGSLMPHVRRNFFIGIRTPWTLSSDRSWKKTHELGAKLFKAYGLGFLVFLIVPPAWFVWALLLPLIALIVYLTVFSYFEWKKDSRKAVK